jgi:response regulator RpfG family c-di-GMP phosphodiesterase
VTNQPNETDTRSYRILAVDDQEDVRMALGRTLRACGHTVDCAASGREALELLRTNEYEAVISDFEMPEMDGLAFLNTVRIMHPHTKRLLLTGRADVDIAIRALNEHAAHRFLLKPWTSVDIRGILDLTLRC